MRGRSAKPFGRSAVPCRRPVAERDSQQCRAGRRNPQGGLPAPALSGSGDGGRLPVSQTFQPLSPTVDERPARSLRPSPGAIRSNSLACPAGQFPRYSRPHPAPRPNGPVAAPTTRLNPPRRIRHVPDCPLPVAAVPPFLRERAERDGSATAGPQRTAATESTAHTDRVRPPPRIGPGGPCPTVSASFTLEIRTPDEEGGSRPHQRSPHRRALTAGGCSGMTRPSPRDENLTVPLRGQDWT